MLDATQQAAIEARVKASCQSEDFNAATTLVIKHYGPEILGYLYAVTRSETDTDDAFAVFGEHLWKGLPGFEWRSSLRTWIYCLARSALTRIMREPHRRLGRGVPLSQADVAAAAHKVRTATMEYLRTGFRDRVDRLKRELSPEDQTLLILRVSRAMAWRDIAQVMADEDAVGDDQLKRSAATLRKRFERIKDSLRRKLRELDGS